MSNTEVDKKLSVLIVTQDNVEGVERIVNNHNIRLVSSYEEALRQLADQKFDAIITDLRIVVSDEATGGMDFGVGELMPYGIPIAMEAAYKGVRHIGVIVDPHHSKDSLVTVFDYFKRSSSGNIDSKIIMVDSVRKDGKKDWDTMINQLLSEISSVL